MESELDTLVVIAHRMVLAKFLPSLCHQLIAVSGSKNLAVLSDAIRGATLLCKSEAPFAYPDALVCLCKKCSLSASLMMGPGSLLPETNTYKL